VGEETSSMATEKLVNEPALPVEPADAEAKRRLIEEARADIQRRGTISHEDVTAWFRSLQQGTKLPPPHPRKQSGSDGR
jgi:hypothetical protein